MFRPTLFGSAQQLTQTPTDRRTSPALGEFADYRTELRLATVRAEEMKENEDGIFVGSVIDNLSYHYVRYQMWQQLGLEDEGMRVRFYLTSALLYAILIDSIRADVIAYLPLGTDGESYNEYVDRFYQEIFSLFDIDFIALSGDLKKDKKTLSDEIKRLRAEAYEQRNSQGESNEEEPV